MVIRNGGRRPKTDAAAEAALDAYLGPAPFALFVSLAHPPNARGLLDLALPFQNPLPSPLIICGWMFELKAAAYNLVRLPGLLVAR